MFKKFTNGCVAIVQEYLPDPFLFAGILTLVVFVMGIIFTGQTPMDMVGHWGTGAFSLLAFSMQMALVLVTGHTLANAPAIKKGLEKAAGICKTPKQAIIAVTFVATLASYINWGFGLVIGALYAKELAKKVKGVDYRLLIASGYTGFVIWHAGISGSIPLTLATGGEAVKVATKGVITAPIPVSETIFSPYTIIPVVIIFLTMPFVNMAMMPSKEHIFEIDQKLLNDDIVKKDDNIRLTKADKMENSPVLSMLIGALGYAYIIRYFLTNGFNLTLDIVNMIFLFTAIILHGNPRRFLDAFEIGARGAAGIILQFPFYAGIMGMMVGSTKTGISLAQVMSNMFVAISTEKTFPLFTFLSAGLVNFFVPSGGGQWAVQAPIMMPSSVELGVPVAKTAMAIAWGDAWTNMIQPFWALPALGIAGLGARDVMGYCVVILLYTGAIIGLSLFLI